MSHLACCSAKYCKLTGAYQSNCNIYEGFHYGFNHVVIALGWGTVHMRVFSSLIESPVSKLSIFVGVL